MRRIGGGPDIRTTPVVIYGLCEPSTMEVRYVGKGAEALARVTDERAQALAAANLRLHGEVARLRQELSLYQMTARALAHVTPSEHRN